MTTCKSCTRSMATPPSSGQLPRDTAGQRLAPHARFQPRTAAVMAAQQSGSGHLEREVPTPATASPPSPLSRDSPTDIAFIGICRVAYGRIAGWQSPRSWTDGGETFWGMVEVSRALMKGRSAAAQREAVMAGFPAVPTWFRRAFPYSRWGAEVNARITPAFFTWLVGPMWTVEVEVAGQRQLSGVRIERCR